MKVKKILSVLMAMIMVTSLAACGNTTAKPADTKEVTTAATGAVTPEASDSGIKLTDKEITLKFWDIWPEGQPMAPIVKDYIKQYESAHPNIHIEEVATQEVDYQTTKLKVAAADSSQGDVFFCWGGGYAQTYVNAGAVLPLDDYYKAYGLNDQLLQGATTYCTYNDKVYGLPLKQWAGVLYCNKRIFDENGLKIPTTFDEMMDCIKKFKENGVTPMVLGAKDAWHIGMIQNALAVRTAGADYVNSALSGDATLDTPEVVESAKLLKEMNDAGAFPDGTLGISSDEAEELFYSGTVPMFYGGSWAAQSIDSPDNACSQDEIEVTTLPTVTNGKGDATQFLGGVIDFFMINSKTENPNEAFDFAYGMTKYMSQQAYILGDSLPCWTDINVGDAQISKTLAKTQKLIQNSTGYCLAWDTFLTGSAIDAHYNLLQGLIEGSISPEEFASQMQEAKETALKEAASAE
jgi:raffinose/stachyose/melibiose transport system substrate-binding protein